MKEIQKSYSWIISDGTKGMENQSIALAKLLNINTSDLPFEKGPEVIYLNMTLYP